MTEIDRVGQWSLMSIGREWFRYQFVHAGCHVLLLGVPGSGRRSIARVCSASLGLHLAEVLDGRDDIKEAIRTMAASRSESRSLGEPALTVGKKDERKVAWHIED